MTDIKIEKRIPFDYKLAIESEIHNCEEKIKQYEDKLREDRERIEMYKGMMSGLQNANYFFDRWRESEECEVNNEIN